MTEGEFGDPVAWYVLPTENAENLLIYADRLTPGESTFPVAVRVSMSAKLTPSRIAAALRRMAEGIETRCAALEQVDVPWCLEVTISPPDEE